MSENQVFASHREVKDALGEQKYIASDEIATIVYLSQQLGKPLLTEGPAFMLRGEIFLLLVTTLYLP